MGDDKKDVEELREVLTIVSEKVPALLNQLADVLYGKERAEQYGKAVAAFYKELKSAGMTDEMAGQMTREYMGALSIGKMMGKGMAGLGAIGEDGCECGVDGDEIARKVNEKVKAKIEQKIQEKEAKAGK